LALLFIDGFDHYGGADILKKWTDAANGIISTSTKRTGVSSMAFESTYDDRMVRKALGANYNTLVVGAAIMQPHPNADIDRIFIFCDNTTSQIAIIVNRDHTISAYRGNTLLGTTVSPVFQADVWDYYEAKVVFSQTAGSVTVRRNEVTILDLTGIDTCESANEYGNGFEFHPCTGYSTSGFTFYDDIYCDSTDFLGDIKVETIYPSGAGNSTQFTPSAGLNYQCVDEAPANGDTDYISTSEVDKIDTYDYSDIISDGTILGVQVNIMARMDDSGTNKIAPVVRPASTDRIGNTKELTQLYKDYLQLYTVSPETSVAWTKSEINNCQFGVKSVGE